MLLILQIADHLVTILIAFSEELPVFKASEINKQSVLGDLVKKAKKESDAASSGDTGSNGSAPCMWTVGEVVWLSTPNHTEWPVVVSFSMWLCGKSPKK